jgi:hypothetical protein
MPYFNILFHILFDRLLIEVPINYASKQHKYKIIKYNMLFAIAVKNVINMLFLIFIYMVLGLGHS